MGKRKQDKQGISRWRAARNVAILQLSVANNMLAMLLPPQAAEKIRREDDAKIAEFLGDSSAVNR